MKTQSYRDQKELAEYLPVSPIFFFYPKVTILKVSAPPKKVKLTVSEISKKNAPIQDTKIVSGKNSQDKIKIRYFQIFMIG
jgi:hypothetical protein